MEYLDDTMNDEYLKTCRFCLKSGDSNEFDIIEKTGRQMLNALLLKLNMDKDKESVMCHDCATKLQNAVDFKTACLNTQKDILLFNHPNEDNIGRLIKGDDRNICRFCTKESENGQYPDLRKMKDNVFILDIVQKYIPEISLCVTEELIMCDNCLYSLQNLLSFITVCLDIEEKLKIRTITEEPLKQNDCDNEGITEKNDVSTDTEGAITIKKEIEDANIEELINLEEDMKNKEIKLEFLGHESSWKSTTPLENFNDAPSEINVYSCESCLYNVESHDDLERHMIIHHSSLDSKVYSCETPSIDTKCTNNPLSDIATHSKMKMYSCSKCGFMTKYKSNLKVHLKSHQDVSELPMYECDKCAFKTKWKGYLKKHNQTHHNLVEIEMLGTSESLSGAMMYNCSLCMFTTKYSSNLKVHMQSHRDISELPIYKCDRCTFETKWKGYLKKHNQTHHNFIESEPNTELGATNPNLSEAILYNCTQCMFTTKYSSNLKVHMRGHQDVSELPIYRCDICSFETKWKGYLKKHNEIRHPLKFEMTAEYSAINQSLAEVINYKCGICSYESKYKSALRRHMLIHQDTLRVEIFKCDICPFKTKHKISLKRHYLTH